MKFINKLRWNHYVILSILVILVTIVLFLLLTPVNTGHADEVIDIVTTTETTTDTITTLETTVATLPNTTVSTSNTTDTATSSTTDITGTTVTSTTTTLIIEEDVIEEEPEETVPEITTTTEYVTTTVITTKDEERTTEATYVVYKPSTHYIHKSTCHWVDSSCLEIADTKGIECRRCSECNPSMEIITEYVPETPTVADYDRQLLAEIVWHEAGSNWISQYNKAKVAAGVMNRVNDSRFPSTVYGVLTQPYQFSGYWPGCCTPSQACYDAVDYYFSHTSEFNSDNSWWGDGSQNHFYYQ